MVDREADIGLAIHMATPERVNQAQGKRIQIARKAGGYQTQRQFALAIWRAGYPNIPSQPVISDIERGCPIPLHMRRCLRELLPDIELDQDPREAGPEAALAMAS